MPSRVHLRADESAPREGGPIRGTAGEDGAGKITVGELDGSKFLLRKVDLDEVLVRVVVLDQHQRHQWKKWRVPVK